MEDLKNVSFNCFWSPGQLCAIDIAMTGTDDVIRGAYSKETLEETRLRYPDAELSTTAEVAALREAAYTTAPIVITKARFIEMLEVLPPEDWVRTSDGESFKMCEYITGRITHIYARRGKVYYELANVHTLTHPEIMALLPPA